MTGLLILIYLTFVGLGLGDSLLGSAWPAMHAGFGVDAAAAGPLAMLISGSTIVATYLSTRILRRFGIGLVLPVGMFLIAASVLAFSLAGHFVVLLLLAIPMGFGVGSVDASGNGFVTIHFSAKHMSWLHCFWGAGATAGPAIMTFSLIHLSGWVMGYRIVGAIHLAVVLGLLAALRHWKQIRSLDDKSPKIIEAQPECTPSTSSLLRMRGARLAILLFFVTGGLEMTLGLWGNTYLVLARGVAGETAAGWLALYYLGLTVGRLAFGFLAVRLRSLTMIRIGQGMITAGVLIVALPFAGTLMPGFILLGLGLAPIFPNYMHNTPVLFGKEHTQAMVGLQIIGTHTGIMLLPPLFGIIGRRFGYSLFPLFVGFLLAVTILLVAILYRDLPKRESPSS